MKPERCKPSAVIEANQLVLAGSESETSWQIDFCLHRGDHWLIRGSEASLQTRFIKTLIGVLPPHAGRVRLLGQDTEQTDPAVLLALRRKLGVVLKPDGLLPAWTGLENLELPLRYHRLLDEQEIQRRISTLRERYELPARWLDQPVAGLSSPQRSALALMRALLMEPEALLVDGLALDAIVESGGAALESLLVDVFGGPWAVLLCQPLAESARLPVFLEAGSFNHAHLVDGRLDVFTGVPAC